MKERRIVILSIVFVLLLAAVFAKKILMKPEVTKEEYKTLDVSLDPSSVYGVELKKGKEPPVKLDNKDGTWRVTSHWNMRAKKDYVDELLKELSSLKGELRSESKDVLADYGISDDQAFAITLFDQKGKVKERFSLGTKLVSTESCFLRRGDSPDVYLLNKEIFSSLGVYGKPEEAKIDINVWVDLAILKVDADSVQSLRLTKEESGRPRTILDVKKVFDKEKGVSQWVPVVPATPVFELDAAKIKEYVKRVGGTYASKSADPEGKDYGFDKPFMTITMARDGASPYEVVIGGFVEKDKTDRYLKTSEAFAYTISQYPVGDLAGTDISRFFISNPLGIENEKIKELSIKAGDKTITLDKELIEKNSDYINKLKEFSVERMLSDPKYAKDLGGVAQYLLKVTRPDGKTSALEAKKEDGDKFIARVSDKPDAFTISRSVFEKVFTGLDGLKLDKEEPKKAKEE